MFYCVNKTMAKIKTTVVELNSEPATELALNTSLPANTVAIYNQCVTLHKHAHAQVFSTN